MTETMEPPLTIDPASPPRHSHATLPTQFVAANGVQYAYRRFGTVTGTPPLFLQHFPGRRHGPLGSSTH